MSNVSIYEKKWLEIVFEGKNKTYGAYQMRQQNSRTTLTALFFGILFIGAFSGLGLVLSSFGEKPTPPLVLPPADRVILMHYEKHPESPKLPKIQPKKTATPPLTDQKQLVDPTIVSPLEKPSDLATNNALKNQPSEEGNGSTATTGENPISGGGNATVTVETTPSNAPVIAAVLDRLPKFPGGIEKFYSYVGSNFEKPEIDENRTIKILVAFVIEKDGSMTDIRVLRNPGYGLDKEAIRVLKSLKTKWEPGMMNGKAVRTAYNLPISVQMQ